MLGAIPLGFIGGDSSYDTSRSSRSAWFDNPAGSGAAPDYLAKTFGSAGNQKTGTYSAYLLRDEFGPDDRFFSAYAAGNNYVVFKFDGDDCLQFQFQISGTNYIWITSAEYRDIAFLHVVVTWDTTTQTFHSYINGSEPSYKISATLPLNGDTAIFDNVEHVIGCWANGKSEGFSGYMAQVALIEGTAHDATDLGETYIYGTNGVGWAPKYDAEIDALALAAGGNSFALTSAIGDGTDSSGLANNFTPTSMSDAANGSDNTPSLQYAIFSALDRNNSGLTPVNGGTGLTSTSNNTSGALTLTVSSRVKTTIQFKRNEGNGSTAYSWYVGLADLSADMQSDLGALGKLGYLYYCNNGNKVINGSDSAYGSSWNTLDDVVTLTFDGPNGTLSMELNGVDQGVMVSGLTADNYRVVAGRTGSTSTTTLTVLASEVEWVEAAPAGAVALNSANNGRLAADVQGADMFVNVLDTEANIESTLASARTGWTNYVDLLVNRDSVETRAFQFSHDASNEHALSSTDTYQAARSLSGTDDWVGCSIRTDAGYGAYSAAVSHTNGVATTVTHNLGNARNAVLLFPRAGGDVMVYHPDLTSGSLIKLNSTNAEAASTLITSVGANSFDIGSGAATGTYDVLVLADEGGVILKNWTGNSSTDGPYIEMGGLLKMGLFKCQTVSDASHYWFMIDTARYQVNAPTTAGGTIGGLSELNSTSAEKTHATAFGNDPAIMVGGGGIKMLTNSGAINHSSRSTLFIGFLEISGGGELAPLLGR